MEGQIGPKASQIPEQDEATDNLNFHSNFSPEINNKFLEELSSLESTHDDIYNRAVADCERAEQKPVGKAIKAENFNKGLLNELAKAINSPSYNSRAGKDKALIIVNKLLDNLTHHHRFLIGQQKTAEFLRKTFKIPLEDEPSTSANNFEKKD
ncbi:hypothetical protein niasHS_009460 [Heterodera schachtii]|uniref:Uncharacterized protein n=1 Tax=Heterodera schachtii TaxID=97005 RepID=A0ABD2J7A5_HETSC